MIAVRCSSLLATIVVLAVSVVAAASDELTRAKDLYRSAAYDEALTALDQVARDASGPDRLEASEYRLFCLIALDRKVDARVAIESIVNTDPFYQLSTEASPRVRSMFKDIRQSLLPGIVQRDYAAAKAAFERQDPESAGQFDRVLKLLDDPLIPLTPSLNDLRTVASGFRDLSKALAKKVEPPPPATSTVVAQTPVAPAPSLPTPPAAPAANPPVAPARSGAPLYRDGDAGVVAPVTIKQNVPQWIIPAGTRPDLWKPEAVLEIIIDASGSVESARLREPFHPTYDPQLIKAALGWKYEPARKDGTPVRFVKNVAIRLGPPN
jgi:hypothetical protein